MLAFPDDAAGEGDIPSVGQALRGIAGPLIRQIRRFQALDACMLALPEQLSGHCAPYDVRLAPPRDSRSASGADVSTAYWYVASATVEALLEQRKRDLLDQINARSLQLVEEFRYEQAGLERIRQQMNILSTRPD
jgi:hypothetical protein